MRDAPEDVNQELPIKIVVEHGGYDGSRAIPADEASPTPDDEKHEDGKSLLDCKNALKMRYYLSPIFDAVVSNARLHTACHIHKRIV